MDLLLLLPHFVFDSHQVAVLQKTNVGFRNGGERVMPVRDDLQVSGQALDFEDFRGRCDMIVGQDEFPAFLTAKIFMLTVNHFLRNLKGLLASVIDGRTQEPFLWLEECHVGECFPVTFLVATTVHSRPAKRYLILCLIQVDYRHRLPLSISF